MDDVDAEVGIAGLPLAGVLVMASEEVSAPEVCQEALVGQVADPWELAGIAELLLKELKMEGIELVVIEDCQAAPEDQVVFLMGDVAVIGGLLLKGI